MFGFIKKFFCKKSDFPSGAVHGSNNARRYYDAGGHLVAYADDNYCFVSINDAKGNRVKYMNSKGEVTNV